MTKFLFLIKRGFNFFSTNLSLNLASIFTTTTILFVFHIFFTMSVSLDTFFSELTNIQSIRLYLKTEDSKKIDEFMKKIQNLETIKEVKYYSPSETLKYLRKNTNNINYLNNIPAEFFPHFIEAKIKEEHRNLNNIRELEQTLNDYEIVDVASYGEKWIVNFTTLNYSMKFFIFILTALLAAALSTILYNTIKINLYRYIDEIKIYSLVGASRTFIIVPILISVIIESTISYLVATSLSFGAFFLLNEKLLHNIGIYLIQLPDVIMLLIIFAVLLCVSVLAGLISVKTFLKNMGAIND